MIVLPNRGASTGGCKVGQDGASNSANQRPPSGPPQRTTSEGQSDLERSLEEQIAALKKKLEEAESVAAAKAAAAARVSSAPMKSAPPPTSHSKKAPQGGSTTPRYPSAAAAAAAERETARTCFASLDQQWTTSPIVPGGGPSQQKWRSAPKALAEPPFVAFAKAPQGMVEPIHNEEDENRLLQRQLEEKRREQLELLQKQEELHHEQLNLQKQIQRKQQEKAVKGLQESQAPFVMQNQMPQGQAGHATVIPAQVALPANAKRRPAPKVHGEGIVVAPRQPPIPAAAEVVPPMFPAQSRIVQQGLEEQASSSPMFVHFPGSQAQPPPPQTSPPQTKRLPSHIPPPHGNGFPIRGPMPAAVTVQPRESPSQLRVPTPAAVTMQPRETRSRTPKRIVPPSIVDIPAGPGIPGATDPIRKLTSEELISKVRMVPQWRWSSFISRVGGDGNAQLYPEAYLQCFLYLLHRPNSEWEEFVPPIQSLTSGLAQLSKDELVVRSALAIKAGAPEPGEELVGRSRDLSAAPVIVLRRFVIDSVGFLKKRLLHGETSLRGSVGGLILPVPAQTLVGTEDGHMQSIEAESLEEVETNEAYMEGVGGLGGDVFGGTSGTRDNQSARGLSRRGGGPTGAKTVGVIGAAPSFSGPIKPVKPRRSKPASETVCTFWLKGACTRGKGCRFMHQEEVESSNAVVLGSGNPTGVVVGCWRRGVGGTPASGSNCGPIKPAKQGQAPETEVDADQEEIEIEADGSNGDTSFGGHVERHMAESADAMRVDEGFELGGCLRLLGGSAPNEEEGTEQPGDDGDFLDEFEAIAMAE
eukprot:TRINITY_DN25301_c0_g1_i1.p1 TRINITY_DN25301_c0_g1~~TRINITY_DN25301_c0_g1_i1.p1  ORF type:complete len:812 (+),score=173.86 TRINITY_DN25301_c0_g1_i1:84-2519(+)